MKKIIDRIDRLLFDVIPRIYPCQDVILVMWLGNEYIFRRLFR